MTIDFPCPAASGRRLAALASACAALALSTTAHAAACGFQVCDDAGILPTFVGTSGPDLDVRGASAFYDSSNVRLIAQMGAPIGQTAGGFYVWGVDTGSPIDFFKIEHDNPMFKDALGNLSPDPRVGQGVTFDTFIVLNSNGTGSINYFDASHAPQTLAAGSIKINGDTLSVTIPQSLLFATNGRDVSQFGFNIWPRNGGFRNDDVTDFAPDHENFHAAAIPEPSAWALMIAGFGGIGSMLRRRRVLRAA
ncbi:MAG: PEPxxWA-CTERM sorting domain-containing protein [Phenylobacterium sp.]